MFIIETGADVGLGGGWASLREGCRRRDDRRYWTTEGGVDFLSGGADGGGAEALAGDDKRGVAVAR